MTALRSLAKKSGKDVSDALNNAILPDKARNSMAAIATGLTQLAQSAKAPAANFKVTAAAISKDFEHVAQKIGMTSKEFSALNEKMLRNQAFNQADAAMKQVARSAGLTSKEVKTLAVQMGYSSKEAEKMAASLNKAGSGGKSFLGSIMSLRASTIAYGLAISGVVYSLKSMGDAIFETGQRTLVAENAYRAITGSAKNASVEFGFLKKTSEDLGLNFYTLRDGYKGFLAAAQSSKIPMEEVREIFKSISNAGAVMGLSNERMSLTFLALEQIMSKGKVSMEELRRQLGDNLPGAFQIGAKAMGMTVEAFDKAVSAGEVYSEEFLPKFRVAMDEAFQGTVADSVKQVNKLGEAWEDAKNKMAEGQFMDSISRSMKSITEMLKDPAFIQGMADAAAMLGDLIELSAKATAAVGGVYAGITTRSEAGRLARAGLLEGVEDPGSIEGLERIVQYYQKIEELSAAAAEKISKNSETATDNIQKYMGVSAQEIKALVQTTTAEMRSFEESFPGGPYKDTQKLKSTLEEYLKKISELEKAYAAASMSGDRLVNTTENQNAAMIAAPFDKEIASLEAWKKSQQQKKEIMAGVEKDIQKVLDESDANKLAKLKEALYLFEESQDKRPEIVAGIYSQIAAIEEKMAAPAKKAAEEQNRLNEDRAKALSAIREEYQTLAISTGGYADAEKQLADLKVDKYYEDQLKVLKATTPELEKVVALMKLRNQQEYDFQNRFSNIGMTWDDSDLTTEKILENTAASDQANKARIKTDTERMLEEYFGNVERMEDEFKKTTENTFESIKTASSGWANDWSSKLTDILFEEEVFSKETVRIWAKMLSQMLLQKNAVEPFLAFMVGDEKKKGDFGILGKVLSGIGGFFGAGTTSPLPFYGGAEYMVPTFHGGGITGSGEGAMRYGVNPGVFSGAPRYHNGLLPDELPAILRKGEGVFTPKQMAALGSGGGKSSVGATTNIFISAVDAKSFSDLVKNNPGSIISVIDNAMTGNSSLRNTMKGTI